MPLSSREELFVLEEELMPKGMLYEVMGGGRTKSRPKKNTTLPETVAGTRGTLEPAGLTIDSKDSMAAQLALFAVTRG